MKGISTILRRFINGRPSSITAQITSSSSLTEALILSSAVATVSYSTLILSDDKCLPLFNSTIAPAISPKLSSVPLFNHSRSFSADSDSGSSKIISIESEEQLNDSLRNAQGGSCYGIRQVEYPFRAYYTFLSEWAKNF